MVVDGSGEWWMLWVVLGISGCLWVVVSGTIEPFLLLCAYDSSTEFSTDFPTLGLPCRGTEQKDKWALTHKAWPQNFN